jgi:hypothetical protein
VFGDTCERERRGGGEVACGAGFVAAGAQDAAPFGVRERATDVVEPLLVERRARNAQP